MMHLTLPDRPTAGLLRRALTEPIDDWRGRHCSFELGLPAIERMVYYAPPPDHWPVPCNRMHPFVADRPEDLPEGAVFALLRLASGYVGLLPLGLEARYGWLATEAGRLILRVGGHGTDLPDDGERPLLAWARGDDPYRVFADTFAQAAAAIPTLALREAKAYPTPFAYLGWCTWEEYRRDIDADLLCRTADALQAGPVPVRYMLIDDGHQDFANPEEYFDRRLRRFAPDATKFPDGFAPLLAKRDEADLAWFGLWLPFCAGMAGLDPALKHPDLPPERLVSNAAGGRLPADDPPAARAFMEALLDGAAGFDFIKVDFMSFAIADLSGARHWRNALHEPNRQPVANPYRHARRMNRALEDSLAGRSMDLMNCNGQAAYNLFNLDVSNSSRCSADYARGDDEKARQHLFQSYANIPWLGQVAWGDHDMFHCSDPRAGRMMAVSKALSGGPIYLSDPPADLTREAVMPVCYEDGRLLRPQAPAAPLPESLFLEYSTVGALSVQKPAPCRPYRVIAPLHGEAAAVAMYHLANVSDSMEGRLRPEDYTWRNAMRQPYPGPASPPAEGLVVWDWYEGTAARLTDAYTIWLEPLTDRLLLLLPVVNGWAVGGRFDKFLGPAAAEVVENHADILRLRLHEPGPLALWLEQGVPAAEGWTFEHRGGGFFVGNCPHAPAVETETLVTVRRAPDSGP